MKAVLLALVASLCVACAAGYVGREAIASAVEARLSERVQRSGLHGDDRYSKLTVSYDHLTAMVEGTVTTEALREEFLADLSAAMGAGRVIANITVSPPLPALVRIVRKGSDVEVTGTVSDPAVFAGLLSSLATQPGIENVQNNLLAAERTIPIPQPEAFSAAALALVGVSSASSFILENGELSVEGVLPKPSAKDAILAKLVPIYDGTYRFTDRLTVPAPVPATIGLIQNQTGQYDITGRLPSDDSRAALLAAFPQGKVVVAEGLTVGDYVDTPSWFTNLPSLLQKITGEVADLQLTAADQSLILKGTVASTEKAEELQAYVAGLSPGLGHEFGLVVRKPDPAPLAPDSRSFQIQRNELGVLVSGHLPDAGTKEGILRSVRGAYVAPLQVVDKLEISNGLAAFPGLDALPDLLRSLAKSQARMDLGDQQLVLSGEASSAEIRDEIIAAAKRFAPDTYRIADRLTISAVPGSPMTEGGNTVPAAAPSTAASNNGAATIENFDTFTIYYDSGAYGLRDSEIDTFVKIIEAAHKSKAPIQIEGFADRKGVATVNDFVSRMRTEMLKKYLVERGIDGGRISSTIWHGAVEGEEEDQQNRRTEIKVGK